MDWFTWLSKTTLDPSLVYNYALTFTNNDLESDDIPYFSHEFLQSMGISIAKHRLEILKVARKEKGKRIHPVLWLMFAIKQTKNYLSKHIKELVHCENSKLAIVPKRNNSLRWKVSMLQRNKKLKAAYLEWPAIRFDSDPAVECGRDILLLTNGSPRGESQSSYSTGNSSSAESKANFLSTKEVHSQDGEYWSSSIEEIKWDSMFKNLKPT